MPSVLITIPLRVAGSQKFKLHVFWKREGNLCVGDKKKSPNSNHAHRTTSHKTEHHWEKMGSHGGDLDCRGGRRHLRKRSLLNGNQMGYVLLNRIPDLQRWAGAAWPRSALPPAPSWARDEEAEGGGGRPWSCDRVASRPQAPGSGSLFRSACHAATQPFARISKLEAYREAVLSSPFRSSF